MKITYDKSADAVYIKFKECSISDTQEDPSGNIIIDYASDNSIVGIEVLNASTKLEGLNEMEFDVHK